jgi:putative ABC transport system permease protein
MSANPTTPPTLFPLKGGYWLFVRYHVRDLLRNPLRTGLTVLGVALGVALVLAIQLSSQSAVGQFRQSMATLAGSANLEVVSNTSDRFDETVLPQLSWLWQVPNLKADPIVERVLLVPTGPLDQKNDPSKPPQVLRVFGMNMLGDTDFRATSWAPGQKPTNFLDIFEDGRVYLGDSLAKRLHIKGRDARFNVLVDDTQTTLQVAGLLGSGNLTGAYAGQVAFMDISTAQALFNMNGFLTRLELTVPEADKAAVQTRLVKQLAPLGLSVQRPQRRGERVEQIMRSYHYNLTALSLIALFVGGFLIYNTLSIAVLRRRESIGTLRALGASRGLILSLVLGEALMLSGVGTVIGLLAGFVLAQSAAHTMGATIQALYTGQNLSTLMIDWLLVGWVGLGGLVLGCVGALIPACQAAGVPPALATRGQAAFNQRRLPVVGHHGVEALAGLGLILAGAGVYCARQPMVNGVPVFGYVAAILGVFAIACAVPIVLKHGLTGLAPVLKRFLGVGAQIATLQLRQALGRSALAVASLAIAIGMQLSMTIMIASFRQTVQTWVHQSLKADLFIQPYTSLVSREAGELSPTTISMIQSTKGLAAIDPFLERTIVLNNQLIKLGVGNFDTFLKYGHVSMVDGEPFGEVMKRVVRPGHRGALVSEVLAVKMGLKKGQTLTLPSPMGPLTITIQGIYHDFASDQGYLIISRTVFARYFPLQAGISNSVAVYLQPNVTPEAFREALLERLPQKGALLEMRTHTELREQVLGVFDQTFSITYAMQAIALLVSVLAVCNTLLALVIEHKKELALLRYLGCSLQQIRQLVVTQGFLLVGFGYGAGCVFGYGLALLLVYVINLQAFGWSIAWTWPVSSLVSTFVWLVVAVWLSAQWPARQASQLQSPSVLRGG